MGKYNVIGSFVQGQEARRAADEQNYIEARRKIEDPLKDRQLTRTDAARQSLVDQYGAQAGDPTSYGQVRGVQRADELQPLEVEGKKLSNEGQGITNESAKADNQFNVGERERAAAGRVLAGLANSGVTNVDEAAAYFSSIPPEVLAQSGTDPAKIPQLLEQLKQFPDFQQGVRAMRHTMGTPERVSQVVSGIGKDGQPVNMAIGEDQAPGALDVTPDGRARDQAYRLGEANIEATRALTNQRNRPPAAKVGAKSPEQIAQAAARASMLVDDAMGLIAEGARKGYIPSENQDAFTRAGAQLAGIPLIGPALQGFADPQAQTLRDSVTGKTNALLREYTQAMGIMSTSINSNFELQNIQAIIRNADSSAEAQLEAMRTVKSLLSDPAFAERVLAAEVGAAATAPTGPIQLDAGGSLQEGENGVYVWTPGTD